MRPAGVTRMWGQLDGLHLCPSPEGERCQDRVHFGRAVRPPEPEGAVLARKPPKPEEPTPVRQLPGSVRLPCVDLLDEVARRTRWNRDREGGEELCPLGP